MGVIALAIIGAACFGLFGGVLIAGLGQAAKRADAIELAEMAIDAQVDARHRTSAVGPLRPACTRRTVRPRPFDWQHDPELGEEAAR